jgi:hypothetical protein
MPERGLLEIFKCRMGFPCYDADDAVRFICTECCLDRLEDLDHDQPAKARFERNIVMAAIKSTGGGKEISRAIGEFRDLRERSSVLAVRAP